MSVKDKPAENAALLVGLVAAGAELFNVKVPAGIMGDITTAAPFVVAALPHAVTAAVDLVRGRKAAAAEEARCAKAAAEAEMEARVNDAVNKRLATAKASPLSLTGKGTVVGAPIEIPAPPAAA